MNDDLIFLGLLIIVLIFQLFSKNDDTPSNYIEL